MEDRIQSADSCCQDSAADPVSVRIMTGRVWADSAGNVLGQRGTFPADTDAGQIQVRDTDAGQIQVQDTEAGQIQVQDTDAGQIQVRDTDAGLCGSNGFLLLARN